MNEEGEGGGETKEALKYSGTEEHVSTKMKGVENILNNSNEFQLNFKNLWKNSFKYFRR